MKTSACFSLLGLGASLASAHMEMLFPPPLRSKANSFAQAAGNVDSDMTSPLSQDGSNFPCKGFLGDLDGDGGGSVATFTPGQSYNFTINGGAAHGGGSCQASLSYDKGKTFTVIHSYVGNCPLQGESSFDFKIPDDTPSGDAVFSWSWFNQIGNREMYQNCASVTIGGGGGKKSKRDFKARPEMFVANVGKDCKTTEGVDLEFPDPGPDVTDDSSKPGPPVCGSGAGGGGSDGGNGGGNDGGNDGGNGGGNDANPGIPNGSEPNPGIPSANPSPPASPTATEAPVENEPSVSVPGGVFITTTGSGDDGAVAPAPTTMLTLTNSAIAPPAETPGTDEPPADEPPADEPPAPVPTPDAPNGGGGAMPQGQSCSNEGEWNCIGGGSQFQRCASGQWSALIPMAAGMTCKEGISANFSQAKSRKSFRFARALRS